MTNITTNLIKAMSKNEREFLAARLNCASTIKAINDQKKAHPEEVARLHEQFSIQVRTAKALQLAKEQEEAKAKEQEAIAKELLAKALKAKEAKEAGQPKEAKQPKESKEVKQVKTGRTGTYTPDTTLLADYIEANIPDYKTALQIHVDAKKKKLMVRYNGKLIFKVFVQKNCYKMHLKTEAAYARIGISGDIFYQNGFNLPYALKVDITTLKKAILALIRIA